MLTNVIVYGEQTFIARRKAGRPGGGWQPVCHAVTPNYRMALCAAEPAAGSDWAEQPVEAVTCSVCLRRLRQLPA